MRERGSGHVIYLSSGLGRFVFPFVGPYAGTKFALEGIAQAREPECLDGYGTAKDLFSAMAQSFAERQYQDPQLVVDTLVELAESDPVNRPMRVPVGEDSKMACTPINEAQELCQSAIMAHFGWD